MKMLNDLSLAQEGRRLCGEEWIFQHDNNATHNAPITNKYLLAQKIRLLDHSVCSAHPNPIENLWVLIVAKVHEGGRQYSAISELKNAILNALEKIPLVQLQKLVDSMSSRIFEVIKANGGSTKYDIKIAFIFDSSAHWSYIYVKAKF